MKWHSDIEKRIVTKLGVSLEDVTVVKERGIVVVRKKMNKELGKFISYRESKCRHLSGSKRSWANIGLCTLKL